MNYYEEKRNTILDIMGLIILDRLDDQAVERHKKEIEDVLRSIAEDAANGRIKK